MSSITTFDKACIEAAKGFLQTIVIVDNEASMNDIPAVPPKKNLKSPKLKGRKSNVAKDAKQDGKKEEFQHPLDARVLVEGCSNSGLICSVLKPDDKKSLSSQVVQAALKADIVCLDWVLEKEARAGERAISYINKILEEDQKRGGRLRLITIYTGQLTVGEICNSVHRHLPPDIKSTLKKDDNSISISNETTRISFLIKGYVTGADAALKKFQVNEKDLPERLVVEFGKLINGLLPGVAIASVGAIREETHRLLAKYKNNLDGPFLTHRFSITDPDDATTYALDLIGSDIKSIIRVHEIGEKYVGYEAIKKWIEHRAKDNSFTFRNGGAESAWSKDNVLKCIELGAEGTKDLGIYGGVGKDKVKFNFTSLFSASNKEATERDFLFSNFSYVERDASYLLAHETWVPILQLGTIVRDEKKNHFFCIQPVCDCVRLSRDTAFPFLPLEHLQNKAAKESDFMILDAEEEWQALRAIKRPNSIQSFSFSPATSGKLARRVRALKASKPKSKNEAFYFKSLGGGNFFWVADIKLQFAQRIVHEAATQLARVGLDEYEWQRKTA